MESTGFEEATGARDIKMSQWYIPYNKGEKQYSMKCI
jgi:hypothetical protein